jgi:hypothetical protein
VLLALLRHSALPFVVLASTSVIAQQWLAASREPAVGSVLPVRGVERRVA